MIKSKSYKFKLKQHDLLELLPYPFHKLTIKMIQHAKKSAQLFLPDLRPIFLVGIVIKWALDPIRPPKPIFPFFSFRSWRPRFWASCPGGRYQAVPRSLQRPVAELPVLLHN